MNRRYTGGPILRYGGKVRQAPHLLPHLPRGRMLVVPYFGAGGLFFAVPEGLYPAEVVNDIDHSLITFFQVLRKQPDELQRVLQATPYSREEYHRSLQRSDDPLEEARRVWIRSRQTINGVARVRGNWSRPTVGTSNRMRRGETKLAELHRFAARLRNVAIDCRDALDIIRVYAGPEVAIYLDPPYYPAARRTWGKDAYEHDLTAEDHDRLLDAALEAAARGARVALSGYRCAPYDAALTGWRRIDLAIRLNVCTAGRAPQRVDSLWMSYPAELELAGSTQLHLPAMRGAR